MKMSKKERTEQVNAFVALCFAMLEKVSFEETAQRAGVCLSTVYRLHKEGGSLYTRFGTIQGLGIAAGLKLIMTEDKATVRLLRRTA